MNIIKIYHQNKNINGAINITGSKSESNRLLIINALYNNVINIKNISNSEDTNIITHVIKNTNKEHHNIKHAGTAMRFLSAYFAIQKNKNIILTGSQRMKNRPIKILIDALKLLGAKIEYIEHEGFPPIKIYGNNTFNNKVIKMNANTSSQYISALMLIGSKLSKGLHIKLLDNITSKPYINMTFKLLKKIGLPITWNDNDIMINYKETINKQNITVESDWSSASYYYSIAAISETSHIELQKYNSTSLQGDHIISNIYKKYFGVETELIDNKIILLKKKKVRINNISINLQNTPDIAQTIIVTCASLKIKCRLTGLKTLKIKETDRLEGLKKELIKIGAKTITTNDSIEITGFTHPYKNILINTYEDHRMAMSFAPISLLYPICIQNPEVVNKSYPNFWEDLKKINFIIQQL